MLFFALFHLIMIILVYKSIITRYVKI